MSEREDKAIKALGCDARRSTGWQDWSFPEELAAAHLLRGAQTRSWVTAAPSS